jgi:hypothetical protein
MALPQPLERDAIAEPGGCEEFLIVGARHAEECETRIAEVGLTDAAGRVTRPKNV